MNYEDKEEKHLQLGYIGGYWKCPDIREAERHAVQSYAYILQNEVSQYLNWHYFLKVCVVHCDLWTPKLHRCKCNRWVLIGKKMRWKVLQLFQILKLITKEKQDVGLGCYFCNGILSSALGRMPGLEGRAIIKPENNIWGCQIKNTRSFT